MKDKIKEQIADLQLKLKISEANFCTLYGHLAAKGIIDDKMFQKDAEGMLRYIEQNN